MTHSPKPIAITTGEPAGIGPDISLAVANKQRDESNPPILVGDADLLAERARQIGIVSGFHLLESPQTPPQQGVINVSPIRLASQSTPGKLDIANTDYVLETLKYTVKMVEKNLWAAMVTAPIHKGIINESGRYFQGHTEFLAELTNTQHVVMMLTTQQMRVALATTHLALKDVPAKLNTEALIQTLGIIHTDFERMYGIEEPRIGVCGLNPHAGEQGHMGREEIDIIQPAVNQARRLGINASDPLPADTIFTEHQLKNYDVILSMFHDQGLPVLKYAGFGESINVTLGLPIIRTSVDHGTALDLAGSGKARSSSLQAALQEATKMASFRSNKTLR